MTDSARAFLRLYEAVAACEAPEGTQVDDVLSEFQPTYDTLKRRTDRVALGAYVEEQFHGHRGRVHQLHHWCPQDESWLAAQEDQSVRSYVGDPWVSILCHDGGSVVCPVAHVKVVEPFDFRNPYAEFYFGDSTEEVASE